jgi:long-chain acyl-CoA synthetase
MSAIQTITDRVYKKHKDSTAIFWRNNSYSYTDLFLMIDEWMPVLKKNGISEGSICGFLGDYSPKVYALIFALMKIKAVIVPLSREVQVTKVESFKKIAGVESLFTFDRDDSWELEHYQEVVQNDLVSEFILKKVPGLIVFTSGSTGEPKGILQDCEKVMNKFCEERKGWGTVLFLLIDHFGGFNTLLSSFSYGGTAICIPSRNPDTICEIIQQSKATLLPTTPTFINLLIASRAYQKYDLSSIKLITYGTEVMPESTLKKVKGIFPNAVIKQTYGLSELGVLRSQSKSDDSVWVKVGGKGFETKIIDGFLWVRSHANMVGYLNAPSPIDADGWMNTGDQVEERGEHIRILGRKSEMINVGGQKVFPVEIETILLEAENVYEVSVFGKKHPVMGQVVIAKVTLNNPEDPHELTARLRQYCIQKMERWKIPLRFILTSKEDQYNERFKKIRK